MLGALLEIFLIGDRGSHSNISMLFLILVCQTNDFDDEGGEIYILKCICFDILIGVLIHFICCFNFQNTWSVCHHRKGGDYLPTLLYSLSILTIANHVSPVKLIMLSFHNLISSWRNNIIHMRTSSKHSKLIKSRRSIKDTSIGDSLCHNFC